MAAVAVFIVGSWLYLTVGGSSAAVGSAGTYLASKILKKQMSRKATKKLCKYLSNGDIEEVYEKIINETESMVSDKILQMKNRIKKHKNFKKLDIDIEFDEVIGYLLTASKDEVEFNNYVKKVEMIDEILRIILVLRKSLDNKSFKKIKKELYRRLISYKFKDVKNVYMECVEFKDSLHKFQNNKDPVKAVELSNEVSKEFLDVLRVLDIDIEKVFTRDISEEDLMIGFSKSLSNKNNESSKPVKKQIRMF